MNHQASRRRASFARPFGVFAALSLASLTVLALGCGKKKDDAKTDLAGGEKPTPSAKPAAAPVDFAALVAASKPLAPTPAVQALGAIQVKAELCAFPEPLVDDSKMDVIRSIAVSGSDVYIVDAQEQVRVYTIPATGPCKLVPKTSVGTAGVLTLDPKAKTVSAATASRVFASNGVFGGTLLKDGAPFYKCDARPLGYLSLHPSGKYGIGSFANADVSKVDFSDTTCKSQKWVLTDLSKPTRKGPFSNVNSIGFADDLVLVGGVLAKEVDKSEARVVAVMTADGKEKMRLGSTKEPFGDDRHGWIHASSGCKTGFCILDANFKKITLWKKDGSFVGKVDLGKLTGLSNVWTGSFDIDPKGNVYLATGAGREGNKVNEGLVFRITGI
jgi:hypothetical protein